jgi:transcriptional regulator with XRE-family HTH domain
METNQKKLISEFVKNGRLSKGLTQKELSERTNVSVRSIQRIENAELIPRSYTLKTIAEALGISFDSLQLSEDEKTAISQADKPLKKPSKVILSVGLSLVIIFLSAAYIMQSPRFPETGFEAMLFWTAIVALITTVLFLIWRKR